MRISEVHGLAFEYSFTIREETKETVMKKSLQLIA